jgi:uncharacterized protein
MAGGLLALLDDVAVIARMAAASLDDVVVQATKAGTKAAGIVIDDAAVTPRYVVGFASNRELPIIWKIALGSLKNKLIFLLPGALLLSAVAPWALTPLLMIGGLYLCFEGYEKVHHALMPHGDAHAEAQDAGEAPLSPQEMENEKVSGAIRTDFILSAEIMAITLASVSDASFTMKAVVLAAVGIGITAVVYGVVALIVKADDAGVALVKRGAPFVTLGKALVYGMPAVLAALSVIGTAAMLWVGGGIILHGLAGYGFDGPEHWIEDIGRAAGALVPVATGFMAWFVSAALAGVFGLVLGALCVPLVQYVIKPTAKMVKSTRG